MFKQCSMLSVTRIVDSNGAPVLAKEATGMRNKALVELARTRERISSSQILFSCSESKFRVNDFAAPTASPRKRYHFSIATASGTGGKHPCFTSAGRRLYCMATDRLFHKRSNVKGFEATVEYRRTSEKFQRWSVASQAPASS